jgi:serine/threonine-protein kinase
MNPHSKFAPTVAAPPDLEIGSKVPPSHDTRTDALLGTVIDGRYAIERMIGEGGMGIVYRARHRLIDKRVAVKVLRGEMARDQEMTERFLQEARTASKIGNGHIVEVADFGVMPDGATYFVMEYLDGRSLTEALVEATTLPVPRMLHVAKQIARGLGAAHAAGIVHRDLKPDNVMLVTRGDDPDFVKILDFGIAKVGTQASKITRAGSIFGTPHYMSPEQAAGTPVDARTDIYALGIMMFEMASGAVPFDAEGFMGILSQHLYKAPPALLASTARTDVPPAFAAVVMKCLSKSADGRYASMDALVDDLEALERGLAPAAMLEAGESAAGASFEPPTGTSGLALAASPAPDVTTRSSVRALAMGAALGLSLIAVAFGVVFARARGPTTEVQPAAEAARAPGPSLEIASAAPAPVIAPLPKKEKLLLLSVEPPDARVFEDGKDLGTPPVAIHFTDGEHKTVVVRRAGFLQKTETFAADALTADETKQVLYLTPKTPPRSSRPASRPATKSVITDHEPDPWKHGL